MHDRAMTGHTTVLIIGAGPAGLVLGNLLRAEAIDCVILERESRERVQGRARAGFLAANTVRILATNGLAAGLLERGQHHDTCAFRSDDGQFELTYSGLGREEIHTVYPQQDLVSDLIAHFIDRGGVVQFETTVLGVQSIDSRWPCAIYRSADGEMREWRSRFIAGCDGQYGISRQAMLAAGIQGYRRDHGLSWLAILVDAPQSMAAVTYAIHGEGFAGHMARGPLVTRYYVQCPRGDDPRHWPDQRIWDDLQRRMRTDQYGPLRPGPVLDRRVVNLCSFVMDPLQHGRLFLAGDAASLISPSAAKGANLAIMEAHASATGLIAAVKRDDELPLARYSAECLPRIWRAQEFSHWMINLLHSPAGNSDEATFMRALQRSRLDSLRSSRSHQDFFAENYVGI
jgi:p-hydroxybenzoate 3-monooxygenase